METILGSIPGISLYVAVVTLVSTFVVETVKIGVEKKNYPALAKRLAALFVGVVIIFSSDLIIPGLSVLASKVIASFVVASLACDGVYPVIKKLKESNN